MASKIGWIGKATILKQIDTFVREIGKEHKYQKEILTDEKNYQSTQNIKRVLFGIRLCW